MESVIEFVTKLASKGIKLAAKEGQLNCYAPKGTLTDEIRDGIVRHKSAIIALVESRNGANGHTAAPTSLKKSREFPLSAGQKGLYILQKLNPEMTAYNVPLCFRINAKVDVEKLGEAWDYVLDQFPILTARVVEREGGLSHILDDRCRTKMQQRVNDFADDEQLLPFLRSQLKKPFDLNQGPLTRVELFTQDQRSSVLLITVHHIVFDGMSAMILLKSLLTFYDQLCAGRPVHVSEDLPGYQAFVAWEEAMLASAEGAEHARYWQAQLQGELPILELLPDLPRSESSAFENKTLVEELPAKLTLDIHNFTKAHSLRPSAVLLAAFQFLLHKYTRQNDIIVGMSVLGRAGQQFAGDVGYFINMVPIRTYCDEELKLSDLLQRVQGTMLDAISHSSYPFPHMLDTLKLKQTKKNPVFQVTYTYQSLVRQGGFTPVSQQQRPYIESVPGIYQEGGFDLGLEVREYEASFSLHLRYNRELYTEGTARRFMTHYCALLQQISEGKDLLLHEYPVITEREKQQLLADYGTTRIEYVHELFEAQVRRVPQAIALVQEERELTYADLNRRANELAHYLRSLGVKPETRVAICTERSLEMMIGVMAVLKAGGAYVPMDPVYPAERLQFLLQDSAPLLLLTESRLHKTLPPVPDTVMVLELDDDALWRERPQTNIERDVTGLAPHNLAYVIYTSGSTGVPKGAMIEHRNLSNYLRWCENAYYRNASGGSPAALSISFDGLITTLFGPLVAGQPLALPPQGVEIEHLAQMCSTDSSPYALVKITPSQLKLLNQLIAEDGYNAPTATLMTGGEESIPSEVLFWQRRFPKVRLVNHFGPTETTVGCCTFDIVAPVGQNRSIPIGRPIANTRLYILDAHWQPLPISVPGELYVSGAGVTRGYLNRPELTAQRFLPDPFSSEVGARMYKTGDLARWLEDGNIEYLGRIDMQVKIRGFRIELEEIEARLKQHPGIKDTVVIAQGQGGNKQLVAFYCAQENTVEKKVELPTEELRRHCAQTLPEFMVPSAFVSLAAIPLNTNGKVDRKALARMDVTITSGSEYVGPRDETERQLVTIWAEVLNLAAEKIGVNDSFFELGGHSLLATQVVAKIRSQMKQELPLRALFEQPTVAQLAELISRTEKSRVTAIQRVDRAEFERLPLSFAQERLWFLNQLEPESAGYNVAKAVVLHGEVDIAQVEEAFNLIIARHENLRTVFPSQEGQAQQVILESFEFKLERVDVSDWGEEEERESKAREICQAEAVRPFDLARGPLLRGKVIKLTEQKHILMVNMHHIITDAWSLGVLISELRLIMEALREGRRPNLSPLPIQYVDYAVWQRKVLEAGEVLEQQLAYWQKKLNGVPESLNLATDHPRPSVQSLAGATHAFRLDAQLTGKLKSLAQQKDGTLYMVLLAAFKVLLYRYTDQNDICVGSPIANRQYGETEGLIGMFVNTVGLRTQTDGEDTFSTLLSRVRATCLEAYEHQDAPFEKVVDMLQPQRNLAITPLFQAMVILQNANTETEQHFQLYPLETTISKFDLIFDFMETAEGLAGAIEYGTALYKPQTIARMAEHFIALCKAITAAPTAKVRDLEYLSDAERRKLLLDYNDTGAEYPREKCIHDFFVEQAQRNPAKTAVIFGEQELSYQELYDRCSDLALYLQSLGLKADSVVALFVERSMEMMAGIMGTVLAGAAYLPLDPAYPDDRLAYMLHDSQATVVLTQEKFTKKVNALLTPGSRAIALDQQWSEISHRAAEMKSKHIELRREAQPHNLNYVIYTSGSTGNPKGVLVEHRALVNRLHWMQKRYSLTADDVVLQKTPYSFDVSVWEFFWPMMVGASLVFAVPDGHKDVEYLESLINQAKVTTLHFVPSMLHVFLENAKSSCGSVRQIFCSGEALDKKSVDLYKEKFPHAVLHNLYGPTEAAIDVTAYDCSQLSYPFVPIGAPIDNTQIYIVDRYNHPQPIGVPGELHIAGDGLARGYLNRPELTQEKFVANPFQTGTRMYKTGDLARWLDDGNIQYLGRMDTQVKIRGFRIELGEIEVRLAEHEGVREAAVLLREDTPGDKRLVAYVVPDAACANPVLQVLRMEQKGELPRTTRYELPNGMLISHQNKSETDFVYQEIFEQKSYLRHGITIAEDACVFDVGANIGLFTLFVLQRAPGAKIYAFEPIPPVFESLQTNSNLAEGQVRLFNCGLSREAGRASFTWFKYNSVISGRYAEVEAEQATIKAFIKNQKAGENASEAELEQLIQERLQHQQFTCSLRTLSEVITEEEIEHIDLLKVDVEKSELEVLEGIKPEHWLKIRQLVIEAHDIAGRLERIRQLLEAHAYQLNIEQDELFETTNLYTIYARRVEGSEQGSVVHSTSSSAKSVYWSPQQLTTALRAHVLAKLPEYMVPTAYVWVEKLPLTSNGKLNRKALPAPQEDAYGVHAYEEPLGQIEMELAEIFADVLKRKRVGRQDSFFELGGHSLLALQLTAKINSRFNQLLPLAVMFTAPTIAGLAKLISSKEVTTMEILVPIQTNGSALPVFGIPGVGGNVLGLQPLSKALGPTQPFYGLQAVGLDAKTLPLNSVEQTATANIAAVKTVQPHGPYSFIGHSYGGVVAFEMARMLLSQGEQISSLILLDSIAPAVIQKQPVRDESTELLEALTAMANLYGMALSITREQLGLPSSKNSEYILGLLKESGIEISRDQFSAFYNVFRANQSCYRNYKPSKLACDVDVTLYQATRKHQQDPTLPRDYGWNQLFQEPIRIFDIEADHFSILKTVSFEELNGRFNVQAGDPVKASAVAAV